MTSFEIWRRLERHQTCRPLPPKGSGLEGLGRKLLLVAGTLLLAGGAAAGLGVGLYKGLSRSDFFQITAIKIEGCRQTSKETILELTGVDVHTNLLALDLAAVKDRVEAHGWVEEARVDRDWPNQLEIVLRERTPVALINLADGLYHVDRHGTVFARVVPPEELDFPVITGLAGSEPESERHAAVQEALRFIHYASRGNPALPKQNISELHVESEGGLTLFLADRPFPIHLGVGNLAEKYGRLVRVLNWLYRNDTFAGTTSIRMDYQEDRILVGTAAG